MTLYNFEQLNTLFEGRDPRSILHIAVDTYDDELVMVTSFQPTGIVMLHMLHELGVSIKVITLDTGLLFPETYELIDEIEKRFDLDLERVRPQLSLEEQEVQYGPALWEREPDVCCALRKVAPLGHALQGYKAWITGLRRDQTGRKNVPVIQRDTRYDKIKLAPCAHWTDSMIWSYIEAHELPYNPLHDQGYPSIGCRTCTLAVAPDEDPRAGRWANHSRTECGIHVASNGNRSNGKY